MKAIAFARRLWNVLVRIARKMLPIRRSLSFITAACLLLFGVGTVAIAVLLLAQDLRSSRKPAPEWGSADPKSKYPLGRTASGFKPRPYQWWRGKNSPFDDRVFATFEFTRIRTQDRVLRANLRFFIPLKLRQGILDVRSESYVARGGAVPYVWDWDESINPKMERVRPEYAAMNFFLQLKTPFARNEPLPSSPRVSMETLFSRSRLYSPQQTPFEQQVDLPLTAWTSSSYPNDWYLCSLAMYPDLELPLVSKQMSIAGALIVGEDLVNQRVSTFVDPCEKDSCTQDLPALMIHVVVERNLATIVYVYAMSLVPMGFALLIFHQLFLRKDKRPLDDTVATIVAAILTVLGIRQVLVPQDIEGLTRVDLILGLGLALVLCLAFTRYAMDQWSDEWRSTSA